MPSIVTGARIGDTQLKIAEELKITVEQVIEVLRENSKQWDGVND